MNNIDDIEQEIAFMGDEDPEQEIQGEERWYYMYSISFICLIGRGVLIPYTVYMKMTHKNVTLPLIEAARVHCREAIEMPELASDNIQMIACCYLGQQTVQNFESGATLQ